MPCEINPQQVQVTALAGAATETISTANSKAVNSRTLRSPVIHRSCRRCWRFPATNLPIASSFPVATIIVLVAELPP